MTTYRLPVNELRERRGFTPNVTFLAGHVPSEPANSDSPGKADPLADAFARGREEGRAEAMAEAAAQRAEEDSAREAISLAFARFDEDSARQLRERLQETVRALCEDAVLPLALDIEGLARRVEAAAALLQRKTDERVIHLNPSDHALVMPLIDPALTLVPDPTIERGGLRIDTEDGGVEDGPAQWRQAIAEALGQC
ncbi:FliH/SctL family protein [Citromicrobium bathyomarinum]|uniref:FliH/SctL family protein n=1 Tax=Citromicrobium bathyomarinum TaxID=72174 RepID=UPI00315A07B0